MKKFLLSLIFILSAATVSADENLPFKKYTKPNTQGDNRIRINAVTQAAREYGAQGGLAWRSKMLNKATLAHHDNLDRIFRFDQLMLANNVVPPVLVQSNYSVNVNDPSTIRLASHTYQIVSNARFTTGVISWRDYLLLHFSSPETPNEILLPRTTEEVTAWNNGIHQGWIQGERQADSIYQNNLARLRRDFNGMSLYHTLLAQHIVSPPFVSRTPLGITGNANQLRINDQVLRIAAVSQLNPHANTWNPALLSNRPHQKKKIHPSGY
jgi:defect-in-organelle-trafficking protein DotC